MVDYVNNDLIRRMAPQLSKFDEINEPFKREGLSCIYTRLFEEGCYCILADGGPEFLAEFATLRKATIFCKKDMTGASEKIYRILTWPDKPSTECMDKYYRHGQWHGVSVVKKYDNYTEAFAITSQVGDNRQDPLCRNKDKIMSYRQYIVSSISCLNLPERYSRSNLFQFIEGCSLYIDTSEVDAENQLLDDLSKKIWKPNIVLTKNGPIELSTRQAEICALVSRGYTIKEIARELNIGPGTVRTHLENIRTITGTHSNADIRKLDRDNRNI